MYVYTQDHLLVVDDWSELVRIGWLLDWFIGSSKAWLPYYPRCLIGLVAAKDSNTWTSAEEIQQSLWILSTLTAGKSNLFLGLHGGVDVLALAMASCSWKIKDLLDSSSTICLTMSTNVYLKYPMMQQIPTLSSTLQVVIRSTSGSPPGKCQHAVPSDALDVLVDLSHQPTSPQQVLEVWVKV